MVSDLTGNIAHVHRIFGVDNWSADDEEDQSLVMRSMQYRGHGSKSSIRIGRATVPGSSGEFATSIEALSTRPQSMY